LFNQLCNTMTSLLMQCNVVAKSYTENEALNVNGDVCIQETCLLTVTPQYTQWTDVYQVIGDDTYTNNVGVVTYIGDTDIESRIIDTEIYSFKYPRFSTEFKKGGILALYNDGKKIVVIKNREISDCKRTVLKIPFKLNKNDLYTLNQYNFDIQKYYNILSI
jgi:hypothetical protein